MAARLAYSRILICAALLLPETRGRVLTTDVRWPPPHALCPMSKRAEAERKAIADAHKIVAVWNARQAGGRELWFYPTIGAAIAAGVPWLTYSCPACQQVGSIDLRTLDRHPVASISSVIPSVSCRRCSPNAPFARLEMLTAERP